MVLLCADPLDLLTAHDDALEALRRWLVRPAFHRDALCLEYAHVNFFPTQGVSAEPAKAVCRRCSVRAEYLTWAWSTPAPTFMASGGRLARYSGSGRVARASTLMISSRRWTHGEVFGETQHSDDRYVGVKMSDIPLAVAEGRRARRRMVLGMPTDRARTPARRPSMRRGAGVSERLWRYLRGVPLW